ncbi:hypothetical protein B0F90DRAFT_1696972 [Multifurca ochricompacta]|uniref:Uncharacterized protein n=1 Tax=Multifurca ochricompacta TaxID=376703 RepID=A0AAD4QRD0_9AGAM|nr:hypothetical protein B0F90DRAFT_1696972 [Multifurca ochricompacta]
MDPDLRLLCSVLTLARKVTSFTWQRPGNNADWAWAFCGVCLHPTTSCSSNNGHPSSCNRLTRLLLCPHSLDKRRRIDEPLIVLWPAHHSLYHNTLLPGPAHRASLTILGHRNCPTGTHLYIFWRVIDGMGMRYHGDAETLCYR